MGLYLLDSNILDHQAYEKALGIIRQYDENESSADPRKYQTINIYQVHCLRWCNS